MGSRLQRADARAHIEDGLLWVRTYFGSYSYLREADLGSILPRVLMAVDFKLNFDPASADEIHERAAARIHHICVSNGGLYIKLAQSIAIQVSRASFVALETSRADAQPLREGGHPAGTISESVCHNI